MKLRRLWKDRRGYTLVEMIVSFVLLTVLSLSVLFVISTSVSIYRNASGHARAQAVADTILEKLGGELADAQTGADGVVIADGSAGGVSCPRGEGAAFTTRTGSRVYAVVSDGKLLIHYRPAAALHAADWTFDDALYDGYRIERLQFSVLTDGEGRNTNVLSVSLTLRNDDNGFSYDAERVAQCRNLAAEKITFGQIASDGT